MVIILYVQQRMEIAPPPPDPPPGGGRMPHTHYAPVMGVAPNPYNTRSKKRARHGESYAVGIPLDYTPSEGVYEYMGPHPSGSDEGMWMQYYAHTRREYLANWNINVHSIGQQVGLGLPNFRTSLPADRFPYPYNVDTQYDDVTRTHTVNTVPLNIPEGRPVTQTGFRIELPDFLGDPFDPTSRYGARGSYSGKEWTPR